MKVEIDITQEMTKAIEKEVEKRLGENALLPFIREIIKREVKSIFDKKLNDYKKTICSLYAKIGGLKKSLIVINKKIEEMEKKIKK